MTDACENITLSQTSFVDGNKLVCKYVSSVIMKSSVNMKMPVEMNAFNSSHLYISKLPVKVHLVKGNPNQYCNINNQSQIIFKGSCHNNLLLS